MRLNSQETSILAILAQYPNHKDNPELIQKLSLPVQEIAKGIIGLECSPEGESYGKALLDWADDLERNRNR